MQVGHRPGPKLFFTSNEINQLFHQPLSLLSCYNIKITLSLTMPTYHSQCSTSLSMIPKRVLNFVPY